MKHNEFENYQLHCLPTESDYFKMSQQEAKDNFNRFMRIIPERIDYLVMRCANDLRVSRQMFTMSSESLVLLWRWFLQNACIAEMEEIEVSEMQKRFSHFGESFVGKKKLSAITEFVLQDIGIYMGEIFVKKESSIHWSCCTTPKNSVFINRPVLEGFVDNNYSPPFHVVFEPIHMVGVQAAKLLSGNATDEKDLYNLYMQWEKYAHS